MINRFVELPITHGRHGERRYLEGSSEKRSNGEPSLPLIKGGRAESFARLERKTCASAAAGGGITDNRSRTLG
jgi:hypothetical protein